MHTRIQLKSGRNGVRLSGMQPQLLLVVQAAQPIWSTHGIKTLRISSANDGKHMKGSLHPLGCALDISLQQVPVAAHGTLVELLAADLGDEYDVVYEVHTETIEGREVKVYHVHVEWQPSRTVR